MLPTATKLQMSLQILGWHLDGSLVGDSEADDRTKLCPDS